MLKRETQLKTLKLRLDVDSMGFYKLHQSMLAVSTTNSRLTSAGMETLHRLKVFTVNVGFSVQQFP